MVPAPAVVILVKVMAQLRRASRLARGSGQILEHRLVDRMSRGAR